MIKSSKDDVKKKAGRKKKDESTIKSVGLFDHIKQIRSFQDPNYFQTLTEQDLKSFDHFMILKALSMNPLLLDDISTIFKYFDIIPSPQFYQALIALIPADKKFYPWVKGKSLPFSKKLIDLLSTYFEISKKEAKEYAIILQTEQGKKELENLCKTFALTEKEINEIMQGENNE